MEFVNFSIAKKLKDKGFTCNYPFAMYNELGYFHPLYTSCEETLVNCMFGNRGITIMMILTRLTVLLPQYRKF